MKTQSSNTETILWGVKINNPDYMEEILYKCKGYTNIKELKSKGEFWAKQNGYNRLRIAIIDLNTPLDFKKTIN